MDTPLYYYSMGSRLLEYGRRAGYMGRTTQELLVEAGVCKSIEEATSNHYARRHLARALDALGWTKTQRRVANGRKNERRRAYVAPPEPPPEPLRRSARVSVQPHGCGHCGGAMSIDMLDGDPYCVNCGRRPVTPLVASLEEDAPPVCKTPGCGAQAGKSQATFKDYCQSCAREQRQAIGWTRSDSFRLIRR